MNINISNKNTILEELNRTYVSKILCYYNNKKVKPIKKAKSLPTKKNALDALFIIFLKVNFQVVCEIRPENYIPKKRRAISNTRPPAPETDPEEDENQKKGLVREICKLFNTSGTSLEVEELKSILSISKGLIKKSNNVS
jgi:hypothetical protein